MNPKTLLCKKKTMKCSGLETVSFLFSTVSPTKIIIFPRMFVHTAKYYFVYYRMFPVEGFLSTRVFFIR